MVWELSDENIASERKNALNIVFCMFFGRIDMLVG